MQTWRAGDSTDELVNLDVSDPAGSAKLALQARSLRDMGHGRIISYSRKVFVPLTRLCRDVCHYCTFATSPSKLQRPFLTKEEVLRIVREGEAAGCTEVLFTLGDKPELRHPAAAEMLHRLGHSTTLTYLAEVCSIVNDETPLLVHINAGVMDRGDLLALKDVSVSQGLMLESTSERLCEPGGPHYGSPDKSPAGRLEMIRLAGELAIPFTTGILIGIGESREDRLTALRRLHELHSRYGHIQEIIIQNFRAKPGTRMSGAPEPTLDDLVWTIAAARVIFGSAMNIQAPPNLSPGAFSAMIDAGINDFGGISPVTIDHVNPEAPWPAIRVLESETARMGKVLVPRLPAYPTYIHNPERWFTPGMKTRILRAADAEGFARGDRWSVGSTQDPPAVSGSGNTAVRPKSSWLAPLLDACIGGRSLPEADIIKLFSARGADLDLVLRTADELRATTSGSRITYVVNRNINYTNLCSYKCNFCAFSKGSGKSLRGRPYDLRLEEIARRTSEAWQRGATEVCLQGGIHPDYTGATYLEILRAVRAAAPKIHIHAFSPLEISHGAQSLRMSLRDYLTALREAGLGSLPGTAAEILSDDVRAILCPDKLTTRQWVEVVSTAHRIGLPTTSTMMFGHVDAAGHWARHLLVLRQIQSETGGITEFVPLPFVPHEAPLYIKGQARRGPTYREALLMHAIARLVLHPFITNIQTSWVKMGPAGAAAALRGGANDLGGTLMNESISRAAGSRHGEEFPSSAMAALISQLGREPQQRTTLYQDADPERLRAAQGAAPLAPIVLNEPMHRRNAKAEMVLSG